MKQVAPLLVAAIVGLAAGYILNSDSGQPATTSDNQQIAEQQKEYKEARAQVGQTEVINIETEKVVERTIAVDPQTYLEELKTLRPTGATRQQTMREIIHHLVGLTKSSESAIPPIRSFLESKLDIEYDTSAQNFDRENQAAREAESRGEEAKPNGIGSFIKSGFGSYFMSNMVAQMKRELEPGSLRLGLFDVLQDIGGAEAEALLAHELSQTGRGLEVAYLDRILSDIAEGQYKEQVLNVTHDLLVTPPAPTGSSLLDESSRLFLFAILVKYKDATFVNTAKLMIINNEGRVDGAVVNYLTTILGVDAVPLLYAKVKDESLTDDGDKMALGDAILKHVGTNEDSNAFFAEVVTNQDLGPLRFFALGHLTGGDRAESTLRNRQKLIADIKTKSPEDAALNRALDNTHNRIEVMIDPSKAGELGNGDRPNLFELFNPGRQQNN